MAKSMQMKLKELEKAIDQREYTSSRYAVAAVKRSSISPAEKKRLLAKIVIAYRTSELNADIGLDEFAGRGLDFAGRGEKAPSIVAPDLVSRYPASDNLGATHIGIESQLDKIVMRVLLYATNEKITPGDALTRLTKRVVELTNQ